MSWDLSQKAVVVTGGAKGIGLAVVKEVLAHKAGTVIFCSRSPCEDLLAILREEYPSANIHHVSCDVSTSAGRDELVTRTRQHGVTELHGLVSNVGTNVRKPILEQTENEYNAMMRTNVDSAYFLAKLFFPMFVPGSAIVNVSSAAGVQSSGTGAVYGMTKAALNQMTRALACEWAGKKIRVNAVTPWMTMTPLLEEAIKANPGQLDKVKEWTPMHRLAEASEIAAPIIFLLLPAASYITGQVLGVDGGLTAQGFAGPCVS